MSDIFISLLYGELCAVDLNLVSQKDVLVFLRKLKQGIPRKELFSIQMEISPANPPFFSVACPW